VTRKAAPLPPCPFKTGERVRWTTKDEEGTGAVSLVGWLPFPGCWSFEVRDDATGETVRPRSLEILDNPTAGTVAPPAPDSEPPDEHGGEPEEKPEPRAKATAKRASGSNSWGAHPWNRRDYCASAFCGSAKERPGPDGEGYCAFHADFLTDLEESRKAKAAAKGSRRKGAA